MEVILWPDRTIMLSSFRVTEGARLPEPQTSLILSERVTQSMATSLLRQLHESKSCVVTQFFPK